MEAKNLSESLAKINEQLRTINGTTENKRLLEQSQQVAFLMKKKAKN